MQIHWHNGASLSASERGDVVARLEALAADETDLIDVWIDVGESRHHRHGGDEVVIRCQARGREMVSRRKADEAGLALREALAAFERDVREWRAWRVDPRRVRTSEPPLLGIVDRVFPERGYGFLLTDDGEQVYFHENALQRGLVIDKLREGDRVGFDSEQGDKGLQATFVEPAPPGVPSP